MDGWYHGRQPNATINLTVGRRRNIVLGGWNVRRDTESVSMGPCYL